MPRYEADEERAWEEFTQEMERASRRRDQQLAVERIREEQQRAERLRVNQEELVRLELEVQEAMDQDAQMRATRGQQAIRVQQAIRAAQVFDRDVYLRPDGEQLFVAVDRLLNQIEDEDEMPRNDDAPPWGFDEPDDPAVRLTGRIPTAQQVSAARRVDQAVASNRQRLRMRQMQRANDAVQQSNMLSIAQQQAIISTRLGDDEDCTIHTVWPGSNRYLADLQTSFVFYRRHAEGHYSDRTLMRLTRCYDRAVEGNLSTTEQPWLYVAERPGGYDEETEVKTGGVIGVLAVLPGTNKMLLATHRNHRRSTLGTALLNSAALLHFPLHTWVGRFNQDAQHFLIANQFYPTAMNSVGAIRYSNGSEVDDDE